MVLAKLSHRFFRWGVAFIARCVCILLQLELSPRWLSCSNCPAPGLMPRACHRHPASPSPGAERNRPVTQTRDGWTPVTSTRSEGGWGTVSEANWCCCVLQSITNKKTGSTPGVVFIVLNYFRSTVR